jgi:error-prone DNA polymerase
MALAREFQLPLLATNGVNMATEFEREILDVLTTIRHGCSLDEAGLLLQQNGKRHMRSAAEMCRLFRDVPEAITATSELSDRLTFQMKEMGYEFPRYPIPDGETMDSFLRKRTMEGVVRRYGCKASEKLRSRADKQVDRELALITKLGLAGYFLIVWDIVEFCRKHGILVQGRGSAANSAVCYSLGITAVDPVGMELLFARFLSEVRGEWPDIDLDLPSGDDRERAIQYVYERYGQLGAAMCANVITYRGRSAAREVGKALGFDADMQTRLTRLVGSWEWKGPTDTMEEQVRNAGFDLAHPRIAKYLELPIRMLDLPRHLGQHSGGMIIAQGQLASVVPIEPASMPGRTVVQWDKEDCADMDLIKVDLLGLGMMAVLKECVELIPRYYGKQIDIAQIPHDDPKVYDMLRRARYRWAFPGRVSCPNGVTAPEQPGQVLRPGRTGGDHPAWTDRWTDDEPVHGAAPGTAGDPVSASTARARPATNAWRPALPGTVAAHRHDNRRLHRRRSRGAASCAQQPPLR